jgi:hypothetical protein
MNIPIEDTIAGRTFVRTGWTRGRRVGRKSFHRSSQQPYGTRKKDAMCEGLDAEGKRQAKKYTRHKRNKQERFDHEIPHLVIGNKIPKKAYKNAFVKSPRDFKMNQISFPRTTLFCMERR